MKKSILSIILAVAALTADAQFLFRISGRGLAEPSYMLGTFHTQHGSVLDHSPEYLDAEAKCQQLYVETDVTNQQDVILRQKMGTQLMTLPQGKTIFDVMSQEQTEALKKKLNEVCHINLNDSAMKPLWNYQPVLYILMFKAAILQETIKLLPPSNSNSALIDETCIIRAKLKGMEVGRLDQMLSQDSLAKAQETLLHNIDIQVDSLMSCINSFDQRMKAVIDEAQSLKQAIVFWCTSNYDGFAKMDYWKTAVEKTPAVFKHRNEKWLPRMQSAMAEKPTMFIFGAGHLIGPDGVLQLLRLAGYKVEQIKCK